MALTEDLPHQGLCRGQVGTVLENLAPDVFEVEFSDDDGHTYAVHNDNDGLGPEIVANVLCRVEGQYSDGMDAHISADGELSTARHVHGGTASGRGPGDRTGGSGVGAKLA